jgi:hypothetical protein
VSAPSLPILTAPQVLLGLRQAGFDVRRNGDVLVLKPSERLTPKIRGLVLNVKPQLLELLSDCPPLLCWSCGEEIAAGAPAGQGPVRIGDGYFHIATCLPEDTLYDPGTGRVMRTASLAAAVVEEVSGLIALARAGRAAYMTEDQRWIDANAWTLKQVERLDRIVSGKSTIEKDGLLKIAAELRQTQSAVKGAEEQGTT